VVPKGGREGLVTLVPLASLRATVKKGGKRKEEGRDRIKEGGRERGEWNTFTHSASNHCTPRRCGQQGEGSPGPRGGGKKERGSELNLPFFLILFLIGSKGRKRRNAREILKEKKKGKREGL